MYILSCSYIRKCPAGNIPSVILFVTPELARITVVGMGRQTCTLVECFFWIADEQKNTKINGRGVTVLVELPTTNDHRIFILRHNSTLKISVHDFTCFLREQPPTPTPSELFNCFSILVARWYCWEKMRSIIPIQNNEIDLHSKPPFRRRLRHTWVNVVLIFYQQHKPPPPPPFYIWRSTLFRFKINQNNQHLEISM